MKSRSLFLIVLVAAAATISAQTQTRTVVPFNLSDVTLLDSPFKGNMDRLCSYLLFLNNNRMLYTFRVNCGLPTQGAQPLAGWEAPDCGLRGHFMGHLLTSLAQAYKATGDNRYKAKADSLVAALAVIQNAATTAGFTKGYLSAFPEANVDKLISHKCPWAPLYSIHKIFAGMIDCHTLLGNATALDVATKMGDWTYEKLKGQTTSQLEALWQDMCWNCGEYGGFNETCANLYAITKNPNHLTAAKFFDHAAVFSPCQNNQDRLDGLHSNTQIPKLIGCVRIFENTGEQNYYAMAKNFFSIVTTSHMYINGGTSVGERFRAPGIIAGALADNTCETCCEYNMLKLGRLLFFHEAQPKHMDYYERALYNQVLGSQNPRSLHGFMTYFQPMRAGGIKTYGNDESFTCCDGTGTESHTKYMETIYFRGGDTLYVNLFIPSQLNWTEKSVTVKMETRYPDNDTVKLTVSGSGAANLPLKIRVPSWLRRTMEVWVNGSLQAVSNSPGTYLKLLPAWNASGTITLVMPQSLRFEWTPDDNTVGGVLYGIQLLAGAYGTNNLTAMPTLNALSVVKTKEDTLRFLASPSTGGITMLPFSRIHGQRYSVYWKLTNVPRDTFIVTPVAAKIPVQATFLRQAAPLATAGNGAVTVSFTGPVGTPRHLQVTLFDARGCVCAAQAVKPGCRTVRLSPADGALTPGVYACSISGGGESIWLKVLHTK